MNEIQEVLSSERLILRPLTKQDASAVYAYRSLPEIAKYQYWQAFTLPQAVKFVNDNANTPLNKRGGWIGLAVILKENNNFIGDCALKIEGSDAEIGFNISPQYQKQGFAKEVIKMLAEYSFNTANAKKVIAVTDTQNTACVNLLKSAGFTKDLTFEEKLICKGVLSIEHKYFINRK